MTCVWDNYVFARVPHKKEKQEKHIFLLHRRREKKKKKIHVRGEGLRGRHVRQRHLKRRVRRRAKRDPSRRSHVQRNSVKQLAGSDFSKCLSSSVERVGGLDFSQQKAVPTAPTSLYTRQRTATPPLLALELYGFCFVFFFL